MHRTARGFPPRTRSQLGVNKPNALSVRGAGRGSRLLHFGNERIDRVHRRIIARH